LRIAKARATQMLLSAGHTYSSILLLDFYTVCTQLRLDYFLSLKSLISHFIDLLTVATSSLLTQVVLI
jgi:hypothetical protein